jgi:lysozyme
MKKKVIYIIISCIVLSSLVAIIVFYNNYFAPTGIEISKSDYPVTGIDISKYNGKIDWNALKEQGIDFVFIKTTEGEKYTDPNFNENLNGALKAGIPAGAYHFFRFDRYGTKQAVNFIRNAQIHKLTLPLVIDVEEWGNFTLAEDKPTILRELKRLILSVETTTHQKVIIYTNEKTYRKYIKGNFPMNQLWICSFNNPPKVKYKWTFWQYSHKGKLVGIEHLVDINTFQGDQNNWNNYLQKLNGQK